MIAIPWWLLYIKQQKIWPSLPKDHDCERVPDMFWWYVFRKKKHYYKWILYYYKYKDKISDGCSWIWGVIIYYLVIITLQDKDYLYNRRKRWVYYIWLCFSEFWYANWRKNDMSCLSSNKAPQIIKKCLIYSVIGRNLIKTYKEVPIIHDKITKLANNYVAMNELMDEFNESNDLSDVIYEHCSKLSGYGLSSRSELRP